MNHDTRSRYISPFKLFQPQESTSQTSPFSALTNNMDYNVTSVSGPDSYDYPEFHALNYPHAILPLNQPRTYAMDEHCNCFNATSELAPSSSSAIGMFDPEFFAAYHTDFFHSNTPSSASSSEVMTPISFQEEEANVPAIASGTGVGADVDMDVSLNGQMHLDFSESLLAMSKATADDVPVDWPQLLATMCDEHPEAVRWFAEMGGFQSDFDQMAAPRSELDVPMRSQSPSVYPHQHSHTLSNFIQSFNTSTSISSSASAFTPHSSSPLDSSIPVPLHHPRPVRPIPQIPLKDLAAIAWRFGKPRGRKLSQSLSSLPLLCQPVGDSIRYQSETFLANIDR